MPLSFWFMAEPFFVPTTTMLSSPQNLEIPLSNRFSVITILTRSKMENHPIYALRPTLVQNGLMMEAYNLPVFWMSDYLYHHFMTLDMVMKLVLAKGEYPWNSTTVLETQIFMVNLFNIWFTEFSIVAKRPDELTYLLHAIPYQDSYVYFLTHYILNAPGFEHIINVNKIVFPPWCRDWKPKISQSLNISRSRRQYCGSSPTQPSLQPLVSPVSLEVAQMKSRSLFKQDWITMLVLTMVSPLMLQIVKFHPPHAQARALCP